MGTLRLKRIIIAATILAAAGIVFVLARGPYVSNQLKRLILPELSLATGRQVMAQKIYINLFPLFIEARGLKVYEEGKELLAVGRLKGYIDLSGIISRELVIRRLVVREPSVAMDETQVLDIVRRVREYIRTERKAPLTVVVKSAVVQEGSFFFEARGLRLSGDGLNGEVILDALHGTPLPRPVLPRVSLSVRNLSTQVAGWPELKGEVRLSGSLRDNVVELSGLQVGIFGSLINASGTYTEGGGDFHVRLGLLVRSFKEVFGLKRPGEGEVSAVGKVRLDTAEPLMTAVDLEVKGGLRIETLMELLRVKERIEGRVDFSGLVRGRLGEVTGSGKARLRKGNLFDVDIDDLTCNVDYKEGRLVFTGGKASLYNGTAEAEATVAIPGAGYYALNLKGRDIDSPAVFRRIGWDPGIPAGKVKGELATAGGDFHPSGSFEYESAASGPDVLGRVRRVKGSFRLKDNIVSLFNTEADTQKSSVLLNGDIDINESRLSLKAELRTSDVTDITLPYLTELAGSGTASGTVSGTFSDPRINSRVEMAGVSYKGHEFGSATGSAVYRKDLLEVKDLRATFSDGPGNRTVTNITGLIRFPNARGIFDFRGPRYELRAAVSDTDLERAIRFVYSKKLPVSHKGRLDAEFTIIGPGPDPTYAGFIRARAIQLNGYALDSARAEFSYEDTAGLSFRKGLLKRGDSALGVEGSILPDERFRFSASGSNIEMKDVVPRALPADARLALRLEGRGTFEDPDITLEGTLSAGTFRKVDVGRGSFRAKVSGRAMDFSALVLDDRVAFSGKAELTGDMPWRARLEVKPGRYDFLIGSILRDVPEDLLMNLRGQAELSGDRRRFTAAATVQQLNITMYGYSFSNDGEFRFEVQDRKITVPGIRMRSGTTSFKVQGGMELQRGYDLVVEGSSALSPLKSLSKRIETIKGDAAFVFSIAGPWDAPRINGGVSVSEAVFGLQDPPHRISSINGYFYMDEDRIIIQRLSGKLGGGDVQVSGVAYLQGFRLRRFYVDAVLKNIVIEVSRDFPLQFGGTVLYKGTPETQTMSGEIRINRAKYRERVEWKSWLLKAKPKEKPRGEVGVLEKVVLDVRLFGEDQISVDNNIARAPLKIDLILRGTLGHPVLFGRVESKSGMVYFRNNEFRIISASADFSDPHRINPVMAVAAETAIKGYGIKMNLEGQFDRFTLSLVSDPPLEEVDILSLLTVGRLGKELKGIEGGIGAGEATSFLTGKVQDVVEERVRSITGLDRLEVDPYVSKTTGTVSPRVTVSKRLIGDRLFVTYTSAVGSTENNVLKLEYFLGKNFSLIGVRDEKGSVGGDVKFRFEFK